MKRSQINAITFTSAVLTFFIFNTAETVVTELFRSSTLLAPGHTGKPVLKTSSSSADRKATTISGKAKVKKTPTQCYNELGCFSMEYPWTSILRPLPPPLHPNAINTKLYCYSRDSPQRHYITLWPRVFLNEFQFQANRTTVLIAHGFINSANDTWLSDLKDAYLESVDANVCLVDWGEGAKNLNYLQVASNIRVVGAEVTRFIKHLQKALNLNGNKLHLIGHSLGAHIMGYVAKAVPGVYRITGLDAAQPGFEGCDPRVRLDKTDAQFVDGIHTNGLPLIPTLGFGFIAPFGHVDIYMNGGLRQPGCDLPRISDIKSIADPAYYPIEMVSRWVACSHERAIDYFTQSLRRNCTIWAKAGSLAYHMVRDTIEGFIEPLYSTVKTCEVSTCILLGINTPKFNASGTFASTTAGVSPYCDSPQVNNKITSDILHSSAKLAKAVADVLKETVSFGGNMPGKVRDVVMDTSSQISGTMTKALNQTGIVASGLTSTMGSLFII